MKTKSDKLIHNVLSKTIGQVCWDIFHKQVNFSFKLGEPRLEFRGDADIKKDRKFRQFTSIRGKWFVWVWEAYWKLTVLDVNGRHRITACSSSTDKQKRNAYTLLNGQKLTSVEIDHATGKTKFLFDLDGELILRRPNRNTKVLWRLSNPNGYTLLIHGDGTYTYVPSSGIDVRPTINASIQKDVVIGLKKT